MDFPARHVVDDQRGMELGQSCMNQSSDQNGLLGGIPTPLKNMNVNWDDELPNL